MPSNPFRGGQLLGFPCPHGQSAQTLALSAAATWLAYSFVATSAKTLSTVRVFLSAVAGTLVATDLSCDLYSDVAGVPGTSLESRNTLAGGAPTGAGWIDFTGFTTALTAGTQYWLVFKNLNATPATNNATFRWLLGGLPQFTGGSNTNALWGWNKKASTNSGTSWAAGTAGTVSGYRIGYSDGSYDGLALSNVASGADHVQGAIEAGVLFTTPPGGILNVNGLAFYLQSTGVPTGQCRFRLYNNTTLLATTFGIAAAQFSGSAGWYFAYFPATQVIQPGTVLRATISDSATDTVSDYFRCSAEYTTDTDVNSLALLPFEGTLQQTSYNGTVFTDTNSKIWPFALLLDSAGEFGSTPTPMIAEEGLIWQPVTTW